MRDHGLAVVEEYQPRLGRGYGCNGSGWWVGIGKENTAATLSSYPRCFHLELSIETVSQEEKTSDQVVCSHGGL